MTIYYKETWIDSTHGVCLGETEGLEKFEGTIGELYRFLRKELGRCVSHMYVDTKTGKTKKIGWVFAKRMPYDERESYGHPLNKKNTFLKETWITCYDGPVVMIHPKHLEVA